MKLYTIGTHNTESVGHGGNLSGPIIRPIEAYSRIFPPLFETEKEAIVYLKSIGSLYGNFFVVALSTKKVEANKNET